MTTLIVCLMAATATPSQGLPDRLGRTVAAIWGVESSYRLSPPDGDAGASVGPLQIQMGVVVDVNRRYGTHFTSQDRRDLSKSIGIFVRYCMMYEPDGGPEQWSRIWCGGPDGPRQDCTLPYWARVKLHLDRQ